MGGNDTRSATKKTEFIKAWFKGVDTEKDQLICQPVVGHSGGPFRGLQKGQFANRKYSELVFSKNVAEGLVGSV